MAAPQHHHADLFRDRYRHREFMIPEELVQQFRVVALERLDRVEQSWAAVVGKLDEDSAMIALRELHTLKGESRMLGFSDVNLVCHKLEDMLEVAQARGYAIDDDFDLAVNMAIRFMAMLVRKKIGARLVGIDLPGFIRQIDGLLAEMRPAPVANRTTTGQMYAIKTQSIPRVSTVLRGRLSPLAVDAFIEYASTRGARRDRLRASWHSFRELLGMQRAVLGPGQLAKHEAGAHKLAGELGKQIELRLDLETIDATTEILSSIDAAVLHVVRNAIDHGIETPEARVAAGKPAAGTILVKLRRVGDHLEMTISDDGRGVALDEVRARAIARGSLDVDVEDIEDRWVDLICQPGFSTRTTTSDVSGRGVGLDVVRSGLQDVGGVLTASTEAGRGTRWEIKVPLPEIAVAGTLLRAPGIGFPIVIDASWKQVDELPASGRVFDLAVRLGLAEEGTSERAAYFLRGTQLVGIGIDRAPQPTEVRRVISAQLPAIGEVVLADNIESLLLHPERL
jgi:two-component system chemotaxis sensor kinase CheA